MAPGRTRLTEGRAGYYLQASQDGGEPPGRWWGPGAEALGFQRGQVVERGPYDLLFGERKAPDGTPLGRPPGGGRRAADIYAQLLAAEPHATAERQGTSTGHGLAFSEQNVNRLLDREPMASPGAACLALAWRHRIALLAR